MITTRRVILAVLIALLIFSGYGYVVFEKIQNKEKLLEFSSSFAPLSAFFTALAFIGLVLNSLYQAGEIKKTKVELQKERNERIETMVLATRIQASGLRLVAMSIEDDQNKHAARRELEKMVEAMEVRFREMTKT
jgi:hypothetical protein